MKDSKFKYQTFESQETDKTEVKASLLKLWQSFFYPGGTVEDRGCTVDRNISR